MNLDNIKNISRQMSELKAGKRVLTYRLHTLKDKPSRVNKRTKSLSRFDAKIHQMNG